MMTGAKRNSGAYDNPVVGPVALLAGLIAILLCWPLVRMWIPDAARFAFVDLVREHWMHREALEPWLDHRWAWLAAHHYHLWFALAVLPGVLAAGIVQGIGHRTAWPVLCAPVGSLAGGLLGYMLCQRFWTESWPLAVMMPATLEFLGGAIAARLSGPSNKVGHVRGTRLQSSAGGLGGQLKARLTGRVVLAGVPLTREDETMHVAAIGATGSGKSTALRALMAGAIRRGDRHIVADPEGTAMTTFFEDGDVILNPFDRRCARWDLLAEIERASDYAFLAQSLLPHLGIGEHDQWITYAQQLLAGAMENFVTLELGSSDDFIAMLATARIGELKQLCAETPAARYFEEGGERMLASILGTLAPAIGHLRLLSTTGGEPFSIRRWMRDGRGSLWLPYLANQVSGLRGLISCWMNIAILETLSLAPSRERRIWFHIDELDALGRIAGLKDAQARLRKFGGCVAIGFQSFAQVRQVYGDGAHTIVENCGNLLILRSGASDGGGTAKLASELIGRREVERNETGRSRTHGRSGTRSMSIRSKRALEDVVLASEIMQLGPLEGFVKRASASRWTRAAFRYADHTKHRTLRTDGLSEQLHRPDLLKRRLESCES